ncbi:MAG: hypothetical protein JXB24_01790 [Bacteroidales bacterium]|nr:hypothetical protein [Bacteroidales bacterium]
MSGRKKIYFGNTPLDTDQKKISGEVVELEGLKYYKISNYDKLPPFLMTLTGIGDHWMFISSNGALTAGRREPGNALFPYTTDDKITDSAEISGSKSIFRIHNNDMEYLWEPFSYFYYGLYETERNIYKSVYGNILIFEEINHSLGVSFSYSWQFSEAFGFVKRSILRNLTKKGKEIVLLDGLQNIMPYGVDEGMQLQYSTLVDAYKKNELDASSGLGIFYLSSIPTDRTEPSEGLKSTTVWSVGLENPVKLLSSEQLSVFRSGVDLVQEKDIRGRRGAYFVSARVNIRGDEELDWITAAELEQDRAAILKTIHALKSPAQLASSVINDLELETRNLVKLVSTADGIQLVEDDLVSARHFSNVLFNIMRGGLFRNQYTIIRSELIECIRQRNSKIAREYENKILFTFPEEPDHNELISVAEETGNRDLIRICYEFLPLAFGRRHGDPSRPWNRFYIQGQDASGRMPLNYQGNWRDIFQNWEALAFSFPEYTEGMIYRFLNASTADGYNPYRITKDGIEWEVIDPDDPWSNIGYWGDHQIIYLLKLLELSTRFHPGKLAKWLTDERFVYTNVPYRIKRYDQRLLDARRTIFYDSEEAAKINRKIQQYGTDGKLLWLKNEPYKVNMVEKLLVPVLAKFSNFIADGGIWLCTQRPEWNDANNALVGNGLSMVTLYHLRRHLSFLQDLFSKADPGIFPVSAEVIKWMKDIHHAFSDHQSILQNSTDESRRKLLDSLGKAVDKYHKKIYNKGFSGLKHKVKWIELDQLMTLLMQFIEVTIQRNQRKDKLFHAYNLMKMNKDGSISVVHLYEMLEGQVAILNSGILDGLQSLEVLDALKNSAMYRSDQKSYTLYPDRDLSGFLEKNELTLKDISSFDVIKECLDRKDYRLIQPVDDESFQFNGRFRNSEDLDNMLEELKTDYDNELIAAERESLIRFFEDAFEHHSFTGRSGTFFKYEGLGSIYWHMVAKLAYAVQESYFTALEHNESTSVCKALASHYHEIREGLGLHKNPEEYGAFPVDPYSHTPKHSGVQQPGMTGQVKEDILTRWGELGIRVRNGAISFMPSLMLEEEFISDEDSFVYYAIHGTKKEILLPKGSIAFTCCQVPVVYKKGNEDRIRIYFQDGSTVKENGLSLSSEISEELFKRSGKVKKIEVTLELSMKEE